MAKGGGAFKIYEEPELPNEGACVRYIMNRRHQMRRRVVDIYIYIYYEEPDSSNAGACLRYMMNWIPPSKGGVFKICDEPESPNERACLEGRGGGGCATPQPPPPLLKPCKVA